MPLNPELTELSPARLRRRRGAKWAKYPAEVLPAWVAEMDFPLAAPVKRALLEAIEPDDCGYAHPEELGAAFAEFAAARHNWEVDPARVYPSSSAPLRPWSKGGRADCESDGTDLDFATRRGAFPPIDVSSSRHECRQRASLPHRL